MENRHLIRFDWAIKRFLRNKADFSVLEGFLSELLKEDITIESILKNEENQLTEANKFNRVDILIKNSKDEFELIIIEIQTQQEYDYFYRIAYNTSKTLTEYVSKGEPYQNIKKIYSINIVYFDLGQGEDYIYHGKTNFTKLHINNKRNLSTKQTELLGKTELTEIFPEYYLIKVNQFDDIIKDTLDEWVYYLKNNEIKDNFTAKGIDRAKELWRLDNLLEEEQKKYQKYLDGMQKK